MNLIPVCTWLINVCNYTAGLRQLYKNICSGIMKPFTNCILMMVFLKFLFIKAVNLIIRSEQITDFIHLCRDKHEDNFYLCASFSMDA